MLLLVSAPSQLWGLAPTVPPSLGPESRDALPLRKHTALPGIGSWTPREGVGDPYFLKHPCDGYVMGYYYKYSVQLK